jgi:phospho-N-acetylmuramoyl-pentapeptide-transferase
LLYLWLYPLATRFPVFNVLRYPSFRIISAAVTALLAGMLTGPWLIEKLKAMQQGQSNVREDVPDRQKVKSGTPTMGGAIILGSMCLGTLLFADLRSNVVWTALTITLGFGVIGFLDDYLKISKRNSKGLPGRLKLLFQTLVFFAAIYAFHCHFDFHTRTSFPFVFATFDLDTVLTLPFVPTHAPPHNPNAFFVRWEMGWLYLPFAWLVVVGTSHAVNLTDGLDGLAIGPTIVSAATFTILAYVSSAVFFGHELAEYLYIEHAPGGAELGVFAASIVGAGVAFLWYNTYPASVFMGDVGALALGGALGILAVLTKNEAASAIIHGVFLAETLSVMLQVASFKLTGRRIFKMAPIHHHFELKGWAEPKIIVRFWILSILLAGLALLSLKLR